MAISLTNKPNTEAPSAEFPFGSVRDKTASLAGTNYNKETNSDYFQFFEKLMSESGISHNNLLDNDTNGYQLYDAFRKLTRPYKVYTANHFQAGTAAPTTSPLGINDLGSIVWTRNGVGDYTGTLVGAFVSNKTWIVCNNGDDNGTSAIIRRNDADTIQIFTYSAGSPSDGVSGVDFEVRVYD